MQLQLVLSKMRMYAKLAKNFSETINSKYLMKSQELVSQNLKCDARLNILFSLKDFKLSNYES